MPKQHTEYVSAAWITEQIGIHASSIDRAVVSGDLAVAFYVTGGNKRRRPVFLRTEAERWYKAKVGK